MVNFSRSVIHFTWIIVLSIIYSAEGKDFGSEGRKTSSTNSAF
ncbi:unnamed protein product [Larinioides sclopetarius]|uniref:Uncharacterized protein n=1 Tax=Larinioides sclopetarius TaxID=280406 RepID=A0AAV2B6P5_9ARAC